MVRPIEEWDLQKAWCLWYGGEPGKIEPAQLPRVVWWHTPNGGSRDKREGKRLKETGVKAGVHDILLLWGGIYGLEFKRPGGQQPPEKQLSASQQAMHPRMLAAGMVASATVDTLELAKSTVRRWGLVRPGF